MTLVKARATRAGRPLIQLGAMPSSIAAATCGLLPNATAVLRDGKKLSLPELIKELAGGGQISTSC